jgi:hypothetical protein
MGGESQELPVHQRSRVERYRDHLRRRPEDVGVQAVRDALAPIVPLEKNAAVVARCTATWSGW